MAIAPTPNDSKSNLLAKIAQNTGDTKPSVGDGEHNLLWKIAANTYATAVNGGGGGGGIGATGATGASGYIGIDGATGATGPEGATGPQGDPGGATGATGESGIQGATGLTGPSGDVGATGASGIDGATGPEGATGVDGATGATGIAGLDGATGATGLEGATGLQGSTGVEGATGSTGATGASGFTTFYSDSPPSNPTSGMRWVNTVTMVEYQYYDDQWVEVTSVATGATGATGAGATGATGIAGIDGSTGATGIDGATGPAGVDGATGPDGATGASGIDGATGATGEIGATGDFGATGATGAAGIDGATGATGVGEVGATGATGAVSSTPTVDYIEFDPAYVGGVSQYQMAWNDTDGTVELGLKGGNVDISLGQENVMLVKNDEATTLNTGEVVYISGANGVNLLVKRALANSDITSASTIGVVAETIISNGEGFVTTFGTVKNINTNSFSDGDILYLSPTVAGAITNVKPSAPQHLVLIGFCQKKSSGAGQIFVEIQNGYELDELHNVQIDSITLANNDVLTYNSSTQTWQNKPASGTGSFVQKNTSDTTPVNVIRALTQAEYDAISPKDPNTIYFIKS